MSFKKTNIPYKETGLFSKVLMDYVDGASYLKPFYEYAPSPKAFEGTVAKMETYKYRSPLSLFLKEYYNRNAPGMASDATLANIKKLENKNCFTVTTGHQLCLFTGPLYFIFKIITTINLAEKLNKEYPANHFVPVYWMASEDHDFAEINHVNLFGKNVEWLPQTPKGALIGQEDGGPVGRMPLASFSPAIETLFTIMGDGENAKDLKQIISDSYSSEKTLAEATFSFVNALFGKYGLVILEPDNINLKQVFRPVIMDELLNESSFKIVSETNQKLVKAGIEPQVNPRKINLFYMDEHGRNRIEKKNSKFEVLNTSQVFSPNQIKDLILHSPEKFSPNVLLRPVYQQTILPNVAYVGGPSEIAYWLQLKSVFAHYKIPYPVLIPRNSALIINKAMAQKIDKLSIEVQDLFKNSETLIKELLNRTADGLPGVEEEKNKLKDIYTSIGKKIKEMDPTLVAFTEAELQKQLNALKTLETKLMRVKKQKEETSVAQIRKLKETLFPGGAMQERTDNFIPFYLQQGQDFFDLLKENFDPFDFSVQVFSEE